MTTSELEQVIQDLDIVYAEKKDKLFNSLSNFQTNLKEISNFTEKSDFNLLLDNYLNENTFLPSSKEIDMRYTDPEVKNKFLNTKKFIEIISQGDLLIKDNPNLYNIDDYVSFYKKSNIFFSKLDSWLQKKNLGAYGEKVFMLRDIIKNSLENYNLILGTEPEKHNILNLIAYDYSLRLQNIALSNEENSKYFSLEFSKLKKIRDDIRSDLVGSKKVYDEIEFEQKSVLKKYLTVVDETLRENIEKSKEILMSSNAIPFEVFDKKFNSKILEKSLKLFFIDNSWDYEKSLTLKRYQINLPSEKMVVENKTLTNLDKITENLTKIRLSNISKEIAEMPKEIRKKEQFKFKIYRIFDLLLGYFSDKNNSNLVYGVSKEFNNEGLVKIYDYTFNRISYELQMTDILFEKTRNYFESRKKNEIEKMYMTNFDEVKIDTYNNLSQLIQYYFLGEDVPSTRKIKILDKFLDENFSKLSSNLNEIKSYIENIEFTNYHLTSSLREFFIQKSLGKEPTIEKINSYNNDYSLIKKNFIEGKEK